MDHASIFVTKFRTPMSKRAIQYTVCQHMREAGIQNASTHTLRHTMATHHIARGTDFETIYGDAGSCQPGDDRAHHRAGQAGSAEGVAGACAMTDGGTSAVDIDYLIAIAIR